MNAKRMILLLVVIATVCMLSVGAITYSKYAKTNQQAGLAVAEDFYFTSDFLREVEEDGTVATYDFGRKDFEICVYNFDDDLRISPYEISFEVEITGATLTEHAFYRDFAVNQQGWVREDDSTTNPSTLTTSAENSTTKYEGVFRPESKPVTGSEYKAYSKEKLTLNLKVEDNVDSCTITVVSLTPYKKTLKAKITFSVQQLFNCRIESEKGQSNATLYLESDVEVLENKITVIYPSDLLTPDPTDPLIIKCDIKEVTGETNKKQFTIGVRLDGELSKMFKIEFFKTSGKIETTFNVDKIIKLTDGGYTVEIQSDDTQTTPTTPDTPTTPEEAKIEDNTLYNAQYNIEYKVNDEQNLVAIQAKGQTTSSKKLSLSQTLSKGGRA